jgi:2-haloacid dehalogenase
MRMMIPNVKALVFDVFGTVVDWRSGIARDAGSFLSLVGRPDVDPHAFADAWRALYVPAMEGVRSGRRPFVKLDVLHRENLDAVLRGFGISSVGEASVHGLSAAWHRLDPWPDAVAGLHRLKERYIIAPLSNGNISLLVDMAKRAGLPWDAILGAELSRAYKPAPEAYLRTADALGLAPDQVCLVAAHPSDLMAAAACGLRTAFVPRPLEYGPDHVPDQGPASSWDVVANDFCDLADRLGA